MDALNVLAKFDICSFSRSWDNFPVYVRVSETLPLLCSRVPFSHPPLVSKKLSHVPLEVGGWPLGYEGVRLSVHAISFQDFRPMWADPSTSQTDWQTDDICDRNTALCTKVHRTVKTMVNTLDRSLKLKRLTVVETYRYRERELQCSVNIHGG